MTRGAGIDPGTVTLDACGLEDGRTFLDASWPTAELMADPGPLVDALLRAGPIDLIAGDFNTVGRSIGFDAFAQKGYQLASDRARGWRGTFPSWCPLYDIDHVWVGGYLSASECTFVTNPHTDHRGQTVRVRMP